MTDHEEVADSIVAAIKANADASANYAKNHTATAAAAKSADFARAAHELADAFNAMSQAHKS